MQTKTKIAIIGGGAAGFFCAVTLAEKARSAGTSVEITIYEKSSNFLTKVRISGGGRCNVTHACWDIKTLCEAYPRGHKELLGVFTRFSPKDMVQWLFEHGVGTKTEADGRMFPASNTSETIVECLLQLAQKLNVRLVNKKEVIAIQASMQDAKPQFTVQFADEATDTVDFVVMASGGVKAGTGISVIKTTDHTVLNPVPSLFTFNIKDKRIEGLQGISVPKARVTVREHSLEQTGPVLITHWGLSGPAILKLSAWGAPILAQCHYHFTVSVDWIPRLKVTDLIEVYRDLKKTHGTKKVCRHNGTFFLPERLWEQLCIAAQISEELTWGQLSKPMFESLIAQLKDCNFSVEGKSTNKEEFVTCGGIALNEIHFKTMESKRCSGLYCIGELLNIDGITGGYNFQACWTTAWIAAEAICKQL